MAKRSLDPCHLDVAAFAEAAGELRGLMPLPGLLRLAEVAHPQAEVANEEPASWEARGEWRKAASGPTQIWLHLNARARLQLVCQRCLEPVAWALDAQRSFRFVEGEAAAAELDAQCEDDVLALTRELDLRELVEEELLLCLPLVPKHEHCPRPLPEASADAGPERANPFAALAALKRGAAKGG